MNAYIALAIAITGEVIATTALKSSSSFTKLLPSIITVTIIVIAIGYDLALYFLTARNKAYPQAWPMPSGQA